MKISRDDLDSAVREGVLQADQAAALWARLERPSVGRQPFDLAHVAYYLGALVFMSAMGWFMTLGWQRFGGGGILLISLIYGVLFALAGRTLWFRENLKVPGGLLVTLAVWMTPLAIYGAEEWLKLWPQGDPGTFRDFHIWINASWLLMEVGTIIAGLIALRFVRFPFLTFPVAFSLWYMSMDLTPMFFRRSSFSWDERLWVSACFGLAVLLVTFLVDRRTKEDFAYWGYLFGLLAFWGGLSLMDSGSELRKFLYCMINLALMFVAVFLERRAFLVFGAIGVFAYLGNLSYTVFKDSMLFPMALTLIGLLVIFLGVSYQRNRARIEQFVLSLTPETIQRLRPTAR
ncbi:MAG: hypothetical protein WA798_05155 [Candidatus Acidiferrum sp.]